MSKYLLHVGKSNPKNRKILLVNPRNAFCLIGPEVTLCSISTWVALLWTLWWTEGSHLFNSTHCIYPEPAWLWVTVKALFQCPNRAGWTGKILCGSGKPTRLSTFFINSKTSLQTCGSYDGQLASIEEMSSPSGGEAFVSAVVMKGAAIMHLRVEVLKHWWHSTLNGLAEHCVYELRPEKQ